MSSTLIPPCQTRAQKKLARDRERTAAHLARHGLEYHLRPSPLDSKDELFRRQPQLCRECGNKWANRRLLPPSEGRFFTDHNGIRWVCHRCVKLFKMSPSASPGEQRLAKLFDEHHIKFFPQHRIEKKTFDFYLPEWNLLVEVDSWSAHHTAAQKKKDYWRDKIARERGIHLVRVNWKDRKVMDKVRAAKPLGLALRRELG